MVEPRSPQLYVAPKGFKDPNDRVPSKGLVIGGYIGIYGGYIRVQGPK